MITHRRARLPIALTLLVASLPSTAARAGMDCDSLKHSTQPFQASVTRTYTAKSAGAATWSATVAEQVYRSSGEFDFVIGLNSDGLTKFRYWNGLPLEVHARNKTTDFRTSLRYELDRDKSYASGQDFSQVFATEFSSSKRSAPTRKGTGSIRLHHVGTGIDIRLASCVFSVEHYSGLSTSTIDGRSSADERIDVLYSPELRQRLAIRLESETGIVEERVTGLTTDFSPIPHPGY